MAMILVETAILVLIADIGWRVQWSWLFEVTLILDLHQDFVNKHNKGGEFYRPNAFIILLSIYVSNPTVWVLSLLSPTFVIFPSFISQFFYVSYGCHCIFSVHVLLYFQEHLCHRLWRILYEWCHEISGSQSCFEGHQMHFVVGFIYLQGFLSEALHVWP